MRDLAFALSAGAVLGVGALCFPTALKAADRLHLVHDRCCHGSPKDTAKTDTKTLVQVVDTYKLNHPGSGAECPTIAELKRDGALKVDQNTNDPWGKPYRIVCSGDLYGVMSSGPDGKEGNEDDVWAGEKP